MAAKPPQHVPDEHKPLLRSRGFWLTIIGAVVGVALTAIFAGGGGGGGASSDNASIQVVVGPREANDYLVQIDGAGWDGDSAVTLHLPDNTYTELVKQGAFSFGVTGFPCGEGFVPVRVVGKQSGHEVSDSVSTAPCGL